MTNSDAMESCISKEHASEFGWPGRLLHAMLCKLNSVGATRSQIPKDGKADAKFHKSSVKTLPGLTAVLAQYVGMLGKKYPTVTAGLAIPDLMQKSIAELLNLLQTSLEPSASRRVTNHSASFVSDWNPSNWMTTDLWAFFFWCSLNRDDYINKYPTYSYICHDVISKSS